MAVKAPPPAPVASWTGFYVGADIGGFWSGVAQSFSQAPGFGPGGATSYDPVNFGKSNEAGVAGSLHAGYNYQRSNWVVGVESDFTLFTEMSDTSRQANLTTGGVPVPGVGCTPVTCNTLNMSDNARWLADLRGRLGYVLNNYNTMIYATGGGAWLDQDQRGYLLPTFANISSILTNSSRNTAGWVAGGGVEYMADPHWVWRAEYLFYSFSSGNTVLAPCSKCVPGAFSGTGAYTYGNAILNEVRIGGSYKF